jgi:uncharacterized protein YjbI with pentapeptide repeats
VRRLTLEALRQQGPEGKRDILLTLYDWPLIQRGHYLVVKLEGADFSGAYLEGVNLQGASLRKVNLRDANLSDAQLGQAPEDVSTMDQITRLVKIAAAGNSWESCDLRGADLGGAILKNAVLVGCELVGVNLKGTDFREADLRAANLQEVRNLTQRQVNKAYGSCKREEVRDTQLPDDCHAPKSWCKPIHQQKRERVLARLERAHAGP